MSSREKDTPSNVTSITSHLERIHQEQSAVLDEQFSPTPTHIEDFIKVLVFLRHLSISGDCQLNINNDALQLIMNHKVETQELNGYGVECSTAFRQEATMNFDTYTLETINDPDRLDDATEDFLDMLEGITEWMNPAIQD